jgi:hypothetical protein
MHWRTHPLLREKLHPDHPDDLQVIVHDGGPRVTDRHAEAIWVTITACNDDVFTGRILNVPTQLVTIVKDEEIRFVVASGVPHPVMVTEKYLRERPNWNMHACDKCGLDELFDAPSDLIRIIFPDIPEGATPDMFTSFCPLCRGIQGVEARPFAETPAEKPWWKFWSR